jgi:hypothetical protein
VASALRKRLNYANVGVTIALILAVSGFAIASIPSSGGVIRACYAKKTGALRVIDTAKKGPAGKCAKGERKLSFNQRGPTGLPGTPGANGVNGVNGATSVQVRVSGQGTATAGGRASGANAGSGGTASCQGGGCLAIGGAGGTGGSISGTGGSGGAGGPGTATCPGATCTGQPGPPGDPGGASPTQDGDPGVGGTVGERADCQPGERAVGGGPYITGGQASVYRNHPATTSSSAPPDAVVTPTAWYIEGYNSLPGGSTVSVKAYAVCASP